LNQHTDTMGSFSEILPPGYSWCIPFYQRKTIPHWRIPAFAYKLSAGPPSFSPTLADAGGGSLPPCPPALFSTPENLSNPAPGWFFFSKNSIPSYMKSKSRQCPNDHGAMKRCHIKTTDHKIQQWCAIPWQFCPICKMMLPD
jgi:hypothetical protein